MAMLNNQMVHAFMHTSPAAAGKSPLNIEIHGDFRMPGSNAGDLR
jgi:hypothetical protein